MRIWIVTFTAALALAGTAGAAKGPMPGVVHGGGGVTGAYTSKRFVTLQAGRSTLVAEVDEWGVGNWRPLAGNFGVSMVAFDGTTDGVSADGNTLLLADIARGRPPRTRFAVLSARTLKLRRIITLRGDFAFDALSPNGRTLYLIQHLSRTRPKYVVRAYDVRGGRLLPKVVRDPREKERTMHGYPMARAVSNDGRWVYTLYSAASHSFVHALDTARRAAVCIDLTSDAVAASEIELVEEKLVVTADGGGVVGVIDTEMIAPEGPERPAEWLAARREEPAFL